MATPLSIDIIKNGIFYMDGVRLIADICNKLLEGEDIMDLSLGFHKSLSKAAVEVAENIGRFYGYENKNIAIGGGTFLNRILNKDLQMICNDKEYTLYQNSLVPPGDGGLALGQLYLSGCKLEIKD
jgi:hydrogenase maturation protein HypF